LEQIEKIINQKALQNLQESLQQCQLFLMEYKILDEEAKLLIDPQDLYN